MCVFAEPFLESKGMHEIFQKKGKKRDIFENLGKNVPSWKIFFKRGSKCVCDYCMQ